MKFSLFFNLRSVLASKYCCCLHLHLCVNLYVLTWSLSNVKTHYLFKLESPNWDQRCKTPWLTSLLFGGLLMLISCVKFNLKSKFHECLVCPLEKIHNHLVKRAQCLVCPPKKIHNNHVKRAYQVHFTVPTVSPFVPSAHILIYAAEGILTFNIALGFYFFIFFFIESYRNPLVCQGYLLFMTYPWWLETAWLNDILYLWSDWYEYDYTVA